MSGFSAEWLHLREPADHRARNAEVLRACADLFRCRESISLTDLGCGTGSNVRAMAAHLPAQQEWLLVDHDEALLAAARKTLSGWADHAASEGERLLLSKGSRKMDIAFARADLVRDRERILARPADLVTAAALFDLASPDWLAAFVTTLASHRTPLYTTLIYNGEETWTPAHTSDADMQAAFHAHQLTDKGFGAAAGPRAARLLADALTQTGYRVVSEDSAWVLDNSQVALIRELATGVARAVAETGHIADAVIKDWHASRLTAASCTIGHTDILAVPA